MSPSKKFLKTFLIIGIGIYLLWRPALSMLEIPVWGPGWAMGEWLAKRDLPISYCTWVKNPWWGIFGPTTGEHVQMCVGSYAEMKPNPEECKSLPGALQQACLGRVWAIIFQPLPCLMPDYSSAVTCDDKWSEGYIRIENPQTEDCAKYTRNDLRDWCYSIRTIEHENIYECEKIKMESVRDFCEMAQAEKKNNVHLCKKITDKERRKYCEIKIDFWLKNPEFRELDYFVKQRQTMQN